MNANQRTALDRIGKQGDGTSIPAHTARSLIRQGYAVQADTIFRERRGIPLRLTAKGRQFVAS